MSSTNKFTFCLQRKVQLIACYKNFISAGTKCYQQAESSTNYSNYEYIRVAPMAAAASKPKVITKHYKKAALRNVSNKMSDETELYHEVGPGTTGGEALTETGVRHCEVDHSTPHHVYQYVETNMSQLAGAGNISQRSPDHEGSSSQKNQVSMKDWEYLGNKIRGMYEFISSVYKCDLL